MCKYIKEQHAAQPNIIRAHTHRQTDRRTMSLYVNSKMRARSICVAFARDAVGGSAPYSGGAFPSAELLYTTTATTEKRSIDRVFRVIIITITAARREKGERKNIDFTALISNPPP